jgi:hypothetical protein
MKRVVVALFLLLCLRSEEAIPQFKTGPVEQIQMMIAKQSCENLIQFTDHIMKVNRVINQQDPASMMLVNRTLTLYLDIVQGQCKKIGKGGVSVTTR